ncbi:hypothetical protein MHBO_000489 [Bonamia ostreae]|uniref:MIR domain-containing protein n=1 Tax=Bonamia ostreae TaxID=126728 RepID=A0ABV2AFQ9_9EUKA
MLFRTAMIINFLVFSLTVALADKLPVTYGSVIKLQHQKSNYLLSANEAHWGSGSNQQIVTAMAGDERTTWQVFSSRKDSKKQGEPIRCNSNINFVHTKFKCYLHSHPIESLLSNGLQVSCHKPHDYNDDFFVFCKGKYWTTETPVKIKHEKTGRYLSTDQKYVFGSNNCGQNCPILRELEVFGKTKGDYEWIANQGLFFNEQKSEEINNVKKEL